MTASGVLYGENLFLLGGKDLVNLLHELVMNLLDLFLSILGDVFTHAFLDGFLQAFNSLTTGIADAHAGLLTLGLGIFNQQLAAFLGQSSLVDAAFDADAAIGDGTALAYAMAQTVSKAEAAAFLFACTFQVPCVMALSATLRESHSVRWTIRFALFYFFGALLLAGLVYRIAALFL